MMTPLRSLRNIGIRYLGPLVLFILVLFVSITVLLDLVESNLQRSSFYLSESLLFSSYWLLFLPLGLLQLFLLSRHGRLVQTLLILGAIIFIHLLAYPALVRLLSWLFFDHTFSYGRTFQFGISHYLVQTGLVYSIPVIGSLLLSGRSGSAKAVSQQVPAIPRNETLTSILVADRSNRKFTVKTEDVLYFSARYPYINIHHCEKNYLHPMTLRSLEAQLDNRNFVRIHRSCIVNVRKVHSYRSRLNGDYDILLEDGTLLRLSRNYASA
ncbi:MAG TPA: LytTR family DNA-binding domain-containing protein, partial [Phnomibacter sp.]|nr:LytTR family DNA-binding domain-containing protein [Phnomibacter sp.]